MRAGHRGGEVGARRGDHPGGERRRVEPVVDRRDQVLLDRTCVLRRRDGAAQHVEVVRRVRELGVGVDRLQVVLQPVDRGEQRRHDRADLQRLHPQLGVVDVERRAGSRGSRRAARPSCAACRAAGRRDRGARSRAAPPSPRPGSRAAARRVRGTRRPRPSSAARPRTSGARRPRASASRRARRRCTGGSGRSLRGRARRRSRCRRRRRLRGRAGSRARGSRPAGSARSS